MPAAPTDACPRAGPVRRAVARVLAAGAAAIVAACVPDGSMQSWREIKPPGWSVVAALPCRPSTHERQATLAGAALRWTVWSCRVDEHAVAVASGDVGDPARVEPALRALVDAAQANLQAASAASRPARVPGMTPNPAAVEADIVGRAPDGRPLRERMIVFASGTRVVQAAVIGARADDRLARPLFDALAVRP